MGKSIVADRKFYLSIINSYYYDRQTDITVFCLMMNRYPDNFINRDICKAWDRLERRLLQEEQKRQVGQLSLFG